MTNRQLINARWRFTDRLLKEYHIKFKSIFKDIQEELVDLFNDLKIERDDLNKKASSSLVRKLAREEKNWKKLSIVSPYFQFLLDTYKKTNANIIKLFIFAIYLKYQKRELELSKEIFVKVANNCYEQAKKEIKTNDYDDRPQLGWSIIRGWTVVHTINVFFDEYLGILNQTASEEAARLFINYIYQEMDLESFGTTKMIEKQLNRLISVNENKRSGVIENISRQVGNLAYVDPFPNQKVKFVAEMDDRTTKMCMSMNDFIFNTKDRNVFYRYSDAAKTKIRYDINGLLLGINLPPIDDHFHYCRSILTYQIDLTDAEIRKQIKKQSTA